MRGSAVAVSACRALTRTGGPGATGDSYRLARLPMSSNWRVDSCALTRISTLSLAAGASSLPSTAPLGQLVCSIVALPPVPSEGDEAADYVRRQSRGAREVQQRRVFILGMPAVR